MISFVSQTKFTNLKANEDITANHDLCNKAGGMPPLLRFHGLNLLWK